MLSEIRSIRDDHDDEWVVAATERKNKMYRVFIQEYTRLRANLLVRGWSKSVVHKGWVKVGF